MTILFLTPRSFAHPGGVERHVRMLTRELEKRGYRVVEMSLKQSENVERSDLATSQGPTFKSFKSEVWRRLWKNRYLIEQADLVHIHDVFWWYLPFRFLYPKKPVFTTFHGWEGVYPPTKSAIFQKRLAQRLSLGTIGVGTFFEKWYGVRPTLTTFGALEPEVRDIGKKIRMPKKIKRIAFFGRLEPVNGIDIVLPALSELQSVKYQILYIGDGSWRHQAEKTGRVTGMVKNPWSFVLQSDLVITSSYLSMLETAALSRPIISIATSSLKRNYLLTYPLSPFISVVLSPEELLNMIQSFNVLQHQKNVSDAQSWALEQTPKKLMGLYEQLWKDA